MARWLVKILKTLINTGESGIVYCMECWKYVGLTLTWDVLKSGETFKGQLDNID